VEEKYARKSPIEPQQWWDEASDPEELKRAKEAQHRQEQMQHRGTMMLEERFHRERLAEEKAQAAWVWKDKVEPSGADEIKAVDQATPVTTQVSGGVGGKESSRPSERWREGRIYERRWPGGPTGSRATRIGRE
jgi:hypothetical protein